MGEERGVHDAVVIGHNTVMLLMRRAGISGLPLRRRAKRVPSQKTVTDLVKRQFTADGPNRLRVTDITEHPIREGKACYHAPMHAADLRKLRVPPGSSRSSREPARSSEC